MARPAVLLSPARPLSWRRLHQLLPPPARLIVGSTPPGLEHHSGAGLLCVVRALLKKIRRRVLVGDRVQFVAAASSCAHLRLWSPRRGREASAASALPLARLLSPYFPYGLNLICSLILMSFWFTQGKGNGCGLICYLSKAEEMEVDCYYFS